MVKVCSTCETEKELTEFGYFSRSKDGLKPSCKTCRVAESSRYYQSNKSKIRQKARASNEVNPLPNRARARLWIEANPEKHRKNRVAAENRRRARRFGGSEARYTEAQVITLWGSDCHLCGKAIDLSAQRRVGKEGWRNALHLDHVVPLAKGGSDTLENVKPAHGECNVNKSSKLGK